MTAASLHLWNYNSDSPANTWQIWRTGTVSSATTWANQPTWIANDETTTASNSGSASWLSTNILTTARAWAAGSASTVGMGLRNSPESGSINQMAFNSINAPANYPYISVTYDNYPGTPGTPTTSNVHTSGSTNYVTSTTPTFSSQVTDPDGGSLKADYTVKQGSTTVATGTGSSVSSGSLSTWTPSSGTLVNGNTYTVTTVGDDGTTTSQSPSAGFTFTVDTTAPATPSISSTAFPSNTWSSYAGSGNFTFTDSSTDVANWVISFNGGTPTTYSGTNSFTQSLSPPPGWDTLTATALDAAGNTSAQASYTFGNGSGMVAPAEGAEASATTTLDATGPYAATTVSFQYRIDGTTTWTNIPVGDVTNNGTTLSSWPVATNQSDPSHNVARAPQLSGGGAALTWNVGNTISSAEATAEIQVQAIFTAGTTNYTSNTTTFTLNRDSTDASYAAVNAGPCSVNLWSGGCTVSSEDADSGAVTGLSVLRSYDTKTPDTTGVFGPGWTATLPTLGGNATNLVDSGDYVTITDESGNTYHFTKNSGTYTPNDDAEGMTLDRVRLRNLRVVRVDQAGWFAGHLRRDHEHRNRSDAGRHPGRLRSLRPRTQRRTRPRPTPTTASVTPPRSSPRCLPASVRRVTPRPGTPAARRCSSPTTPTTRSPRSR